VIAGGVVVVLAAAGVAVGVTDPFGSSGPASNGAIDNAAPTSLATVTQGPLSSQIQVNATLGYAGSYNVVNHAMGTFTALPPVGQIIHQGEVLYMVSASPVILLYGQVPAYRTLQEGLSGADVRQLNRALVSLGDAKTSELNPRSSYFNAETTEALVRLQKHLGVSQTGVLTLGQAVFLPAAIRITTVSAQLGTQGGPGPVMQATSTTRQVSIALDAAQQSNVKVGDSVTITLPNNQTTPGTVSYVGTVATAPTSTTTTPTITVDATPSDPAATGSLDQAPVQVSITAVSIPSAITVPVNALLALANGGYGVEVVGAGGVHRVVPVGLGLFDDAAGLVQVTGTGLTPGERIVVPAV